MWRPAANKVTGTNDIPVANKRRFGLPEEAPPPPPAAASSAYGKPSAAEIQYFNGRIDRERKEGRVDERDVKPETRRDDDYYRHDEKDSRDRYRDDRDREMERGRDRDRERRYDDRDGGDRRDPARGRDPAPVDEPRKRRSRWGDESTKVDVPGMPVALTGNVSQSELDNYAIHVRLEEINRKLRTGDFIPPPGQRSPSPPPQYDAYGRRTNTVDLRYRKKLEDERIRLIDRAMKADPNFRPPMDIAIGSRRGFGRPQDKVYIPVKEFPEINFFGLLVGPRGNSLKNMERQSGAKISIRGKGSVKEGKERGGAPGGKPGGFGDEDDELHCLIMADDEQKVKACVALINKVIETAASTPEGQNDHKRHQLRELASLNGTLRDDENQLCQNCGEKGHRRWDCPAQRMYSANVICRLCGGAGHMARDCRGRGDPNMQTNKQNQFDSEYSALMAELGEGGAPGSSNVPAGAVTGAPAEQRVPPWRIPENWMGNRGPYQGGPGGPGGPPQGYQQQQGYGQQGGGFGGQQGGYGHPGGGYQQQGPPGGYGQQQQQGPPGGGQPGGDPYAGYYAGLGQQAPQAA